MSPGSKLQQVFAARTIAVVGASPDTGKIGGRPLAYMLASGFAGQLVGINPRYASVQGVPCFPLLTAVEQPVDLAIVCTPADTVESVILDGIAARTHSFVIFSSGFAETSPRGAAAQRRLGELVAQRGINILGPNCLGVADSRSGLIASFTTALESSRPLGGHFSFAGQSGAIGSYWLEAVGRVGIGFNKWVTTGNECDIDICDALEFFVEDEATHLIGLYLEGVRNQRRFREALCGAASKRKPVIVIKSGRTAAGSAAAAAHTGSDAGDDATYRALFEECGVARVHSVSEMINVARLHTRMRTPIGKRIGLISVSGGGGVMLADAASDAGFEIQQYTDATRTQLASLMPSYVHPRNPLDLTGAVLSEPARIAALGKIICEDPGVDLMLILFGLLSSVARPIAQSLMQLHATSRVPLCVVWISALPEVTAAMERAGIVVFSDIPEAVEALTALRISNIQSLASQQVTGDDCLENL